MIAAWKIRREMQRLGQQVSALHEAVWEPWVQRHHDRAFAKGFPVYDGAIGPNSKLALYLVYQPGSLPPSIVETCKFLTDHGYSTLIVANGGLSSESRALLLPQVWKILERPNIGYDFGGYRDGILQLLAWQNEPEKLLILNDSIWFPIFPDEPFLAQMEAADKDVVGTVLRRKNGRDFLESYLYLMNGAVLKNPAVQNFWRSFRLTANKYKVIRRGERGHSAALTDAGFTLYPMFSADRFLTELTKQDDVFLERTLRYGVAETVGLAENHARLLRMQKTADWRKAVLDHIKQVLQSAQFYSAFPYASVQLMHYPVLKRSGDMVSALWRKAYLAAIEAGDLDAPKISVFAELKSLVPHETAR